MRAHNVLENFVKEDIKITQDVILQIDRKENRLESQLKLSGMNICYFHPMLAGASDFCKDDNVDEDDVPLQMVQRENSALKNKHYEAYHPVKSESLINVADKYNMILMPSTDNELDSVSLDLNVDTGSPVSNIVKAKRKLTKADKHKNGHVIKKSKKTKTDHKQRKSKKHMKIKIDPIDEKLNCLKVENEEIENRTKKSTPTDKKDSIIKKRSRPTLDESFFEGYATIVLLTPEQAKKEVLQRKDSSNYINCQFKCDLCYRGFEAQSTYENHMKKHSPVSNLK
ncbi:hypothetical protein EVAR_95688_1 [Eumeta japonica]|uniref:C2H2-type domain-containing protein n=1 Tax=Eumeta variegata TaxID=151549 RepID=A0A4C1VIL3_EUMVA|nr:hypothetical protein EVAR_95688_1 [Eumeta japonica]